MIAHPARSAADEAGAAGRAPPEARRRRRRALGGRARARRVLDPARQRRGAGSSRVGAPTIGGHEITPFGFSVVPFLIARRPRHPLVLRVRGRSGASGAGQDALLDRALLKIEPLQAGLSTLADAAARPARHVLRAARLPPGRARARRVRDGQEAVPDVRHDAHRGAARPEDRGAAVAASASARSASWRWSIAALLSCMGTIDVELQRRRLRDRARRSSASAPGCSLSQLGNVIMSSAPPAGVERGRAASRARRRTSARRSAPR